MKQTAVDWFFEVLFEYNYLNNDAKHLLKVAKEMEKEQIMEAWFDGTTNWDSESSSEQYYNETFKSK